MTRPYLLGFVRDESKVPNLGEYKVNSTTKERVSVLWSKSPTELFQSKEEFLQAILQFYEDLNSQQITYLPAQAGIRVGEERNITEILEKYELQLEDALAKVQGCFEIFVNLKLNLSENPNPTDGLLNPQSEGKDYFRKIRIRLQEKENRIRKIKERVDQLNNPMRLWFKDYRLEIAHDEREIELAYLVPFTVREQFTDELHIRLQELDWSFQATGPWPPFHFSEVKLQPQSFLVHKSLSWLKENC